MKIEEKIDNLKSYLKDKKCILAFSAGSDSTLLAYILSEVSADSLLITIDNGMMSPKFLEYTTKKAKEFSMKHKIIRLNFLDDPTFISNNHERCYNCRNIMYSNIKKLPEFNDFDYFIEGTNLTDLLEDRPGVVVAYNLKMISPLIECKFKKEDVFNAINLLNLSYSPDTTCLATRIKMNESVSDTKLKRVNNAEEYIKTKIDQENIRVRCEKDTATISVDNPNALLNEELINEIRTKFSEEFNFKKILIDVTGYTKTDLKVEKMKNMNYFKLPYKINIEKTAEKFKEIYGEDKVKVKKDFVEYDTTIINQVGIVSILLVSRVSMLLNSEIKEYFYNNILPYIVRENV